MKPLKVNPKFRSNMWSPERRVWYQKNEDAPKKKVYAVAYDTRPKGMVGQSFSTREEAEKHLPTYREKGWTGPIVELDAPKPLTKEEKEDLKEASKFLRKITGRM